MRRYGQDRGASPRAKGPVGLVPGAPLSSRARIPLLVICILMVAAVIRRVVAGIIELVVSTHQIRRKPLGGVTLFVRFSRAKLILLVALLVRDVRSAMGLSTPDDALVNAVGCRKLHSTQENHQS